MIKAVIFDFFGVLVTEGFTQLRETFFEDNREKETQALELMRQVDTGYLDEKSFAAQLAELAGTTPMKVQELLGGNRPNKALLTFIRSELAGKYKIGMLSNSGDDYPNRLLTKEDLELFDDVLLSYKVGIVKPQSAIYELAAERLGLPTEECLFTDDSEGHCIGARQSGMKIILYKDFALFKIELLKYLN